MKGVDEMRRRWKENEGNGEDEKRRWKEKNIEELEDEGRKRWKDYEIIKEIMKIEDRR